MFSSIIKRPHTHNPEQKVSVGWLFVNSTRGVTSVGSLTSVEMDRKKNHIHHHQLTITGRNSPKNEKNEKWIIVYKTDKSKKKPPEKEKEKEKSRSVCRWSTSLQPRTELFAWQGWEHFTWQGCTINLLQTVAPKEPRDYETAQDRISNAASIWSLHRINALMPMHWFEQMVVFILFMCSQFHMHMCVSEFLPPSPVQ